MSGASGRATTFTGGSGNGSNIGGATATSSNPPCSAANSPTGDQHITVKDGRNVTRDVEILVPSTANSGTSLAITFVFHGAGGTSAGAKGMNIQAAAGAANSAIFVFPQGVEFQTYGVGWDDTCGGYDVVLFDNILSKLQSSYCVDLSRVYVAGFSWGCDFVTALACCRGDRIRAVAAASCSDEFSSANDYKSYANYPCPTVSHAAIRFTHDVNSDGGYTAAQFALTSKLYQSFEGCSGTSSATTPAPCVAYQNCSHDFVECAYQNLGHTVPSNWASDSWSFFVQSK